MIRRAFRMSVAEGMEREYERRHNPIWPELEQTLIEHGVHSYSIFLDPETRALFAYVEMDSEEQWAAVAGTDVCQRWWRHMRELMPSNPDCSPVSRECPEVFHIERPAVAERASR
jgi:L-rhamnose mutarotase